jgi:uncharacterized repeat protein (TIGR03803 family)
MKMKTNVRINRRLTVATLVLLAVSTASADKWKANNTVPLNQPTSWTNNAVPTGSEFAVWDSTVTGPLTNSLGANLTWGGIKILNPGGPVTLAAGNTLTPVGAPATGLELSSASQDLTINCALNLPASRIWNVASDRTLTVNGTVGGVGGLRKAGPGLLVLNATNPCTGSIMASNGTLLVNGFLAAVTNVTVQSGATLGGNGLIGGPVTVEAGATLSPGIGIPWPPHTLTVSNTLTLAADSTTIMQLNKTAGTNDQVRGLTTVTYDGTLVVTNHAGTLTAGDSFKLFDASNYVGNVTRITPASPGIGIEWDLSYLPVHGSLRVAAQQLSTYTITISNCCSLIANQLDKPGGNTLSNIMPTLPCDAVFEKYDNASSNWITTTYSTATGWSNGAITLDPGEGAFLCPCCSNDFTVTLTGYPHPDGTNSFFGLVSRLTNAPGTYQTITKQAPQDGDTVWQWHCSGYTAYIFSAGAWYDNYTGDPMPDPIAGVGEAIWIYPPGSEPPVRPQVPCSTNCVSTLALTCATNKTVLACRSCLLSNGLPTEQVLRSFTGTGGDGAKPLARLLPASDGMLYAGTTAGGSNDLGTVFRLNPDGTSYEILHHFNGSDGRGARGLVEGNDGMLYGTTGFGGSGSYGTVFKLNKDGSGYTVLHNFSVAGQDALYPYGGLIVGQDGWLYGSTYRGGTNAEGTVFKINTNGTGYAILHHFPSGSQDGYGPYNEASLVQGANGTLYGTTYNGGSNGIGTVFTLGTNGADYAVLYHFLTNNIEGGNPIGGLIIGSDGRLYGTTYAGGSNGVGTVFGLDTNGTGFSVLHHCATNGLDGKSPYNGLAEGCDGALYGTTSMGGTNDGGTVFRLNKDGSAYTVLCCFTGQNGDGSGAFADPVFGPDGALYGTTRNGGTNAQGTVFALRWGESSRWDFDPPIVTGICCTNYSLTVLSTVTNDLCPPTFTRTWQAVCGTNTNTCSQTVTIADAPPFVVWPPASEVVTCGCPVVFFIWACGGAPLTYQWYHNGLAIPNETNDFLCILKTQLADAGDYSVIVCNPCGCLSNGPVTLTVACPPVYVDLVMPLLPESFWLDSWNTAELFYTFAVKNQGTLPALNVVVNNTVPETEPGLAIIDVWAERGGAVGLDPKVVPFEVGKLDPGESLSLTVWLESTDFGFRDTEHIRFTAQAVSSGDEQSPGNNLITLDWYHMFPPVIEAQPVGQTVLPGGDARFTVKIYVGCATPLSYQWRFNGTDLPGQTTSALALNGITEQQYGDYSVRIANSYDHIVSDTATLSGGSGFPPSLFVTMDTPNPVIEVNGLAEYSATVRNAGSPASQVSLVNTFPTDFQVISASLTRGTVTAIHKDSLEADLGPLGFNASVILHVLGRVPGAGTFTFGTDAVPTPAGNSTHGSVSVATGTVPSITTPPANQTVNQGDSAEFTVVASSALTLTYQWRFNGEPINGATSTKLSLSEVLASVAGTYDVVVHNTVGSVTSDPAMLTVTYPSELHIEFSGGVLSVRGTDGPNHVELKKNGDQIRVVNVNSDVPPFPIEEHPLAEITSIIVDAGPGNDIIVVHDDLDTALATKQVTLRSGGTDSYILGTTKGIGGLRFDGPDGTLTSANLLELKSTAQGIQTEATALKDLANDIRQEGSNYVLRASLEYLLTAYTNLVQASETLAGSGYTNLIVAASNLYQGAATGTVAVATNYLNEAALKLAAAQSLGLCLGYTNTILDLIAALTNKAHVPWACYQAPCPCTTHFPPHLLPEEYNDKHEVDIAGTPLETEIEELLDLIEQVNEQFEQQIALSEWYVQLCGPPEDFLRWSTNFVERLTDFGTNTAAAGDSLTNAAEAFQTAAEAIRAEAEGNTTSLAEALAAKAASLETFVNAIETIVAGLEDRLAQLATDSSGPSCQPKTPESNCGCTDPKTTKTITGAGFIWGTMQNDNITALSASLIFGRGGDDLINGSGQSDFIFGGAGSDVVHAGAGTLDIVFGGECDDCLEGGDGIDILVGGAGNDTLSGGDGMDLLIGWDGDDQLCGGEKYDVLIGGPGIDTMNGDDDSDFMFGGAGVDTMDGGGGTEVEFLGQTYTLGNLMLGGNDGDSMTGGDGIDVMLGQAGDETKMDGGDNIDVMFGGDGADTMDGGAGGVLFTIPVNGVPVDVRLGNVMFGGADGDNMTGGKDLDIMFGQAGADTINGGDGDHSQVAFNVVLSLFLDDLLFGGADNDTISGGTGGDWIWGGGGDDILHDLSEETADRPTDAQKLEAKLDINWIFGGSEADTITNKWGINLVFGNDGDDEIDGHGGSAVLNLLFGNRGNDKIYAGGLLCVAFGNDDDDDIYGSGGLEVLFGNQGNDKIHGNSGINLIFGNQGDDELWGGDFLDLMFGNEGDDFLQGGIGWGLLFGNQGNDEVRGGAGLDVLFGNEGCDRLFGEDGLDLLFGNEDDDYLEGGNDVDLLFGNEGNDELHGGAGLDVLFGNAGNDRLFGDSGLNFLFGNEGNDQLQGGDDGNVLFGGTGTDTLIGGGGSDLLYGGGGDDIDYLDGKAGTDILLGGPGDDTLFGGSGTDFLLGGAGNDNLYGGDEAETDFLFGGSEDDCLAGGPGNDFLFGNRGNDRLYGGAGNDFLFGNKDNDTLEGGSGTDFLFGNKDDDNLHGGPDTDWLFNGSGSDAKKDKDGGDDGTERCAVVRSFSEVHGFVWLDANGNGVFDHGEFGLAHVPVNLTGQPDTASSTNIWNTCPDELGRFWFTNLGSGCPTVKITVQRGYVQTYPANYGKYTRCLDGANIVTGLDFGLRPCTNAVVQLLTAFSTNINNHSALTLTFSQPLSADCIYNLNQYAIRPPVPIESVVLLDDPRQLRLITSGQFSPGGTYTVWVTNVCDVCTNFTAVGAGLPFVANGVSGAAVSLVFDGSKFSLLQSQPGMLQWATNVTGPWTDLSDSGAPIVVVPTNKASFYRLKLQP